MDTINEVAKAFWRMVEGKTVLAFHGQMGAGKTTFIHALCAVKGVREGLGSPSFSLVNEYVYDDNGMPRTLYHLDLYRIRDEEEAIRAGIEDVLYSGHTCLVEWPEKAPGIFPEDTLHIWLEPLDSTTRRITIGDY